MAAQPGPAMIDGRAQEAADGATTRKSTAGRRDSPRATTLAMSVFRRSDR